MLHLLSMFFLFILQFQNPKLHFFSFCFEHVKSALKLLNLRLFLSQTVFCLYKPPVNMFQLFYSLILQVLRSATFSVCNFLSNPSFSSNLALSSYIFVRCSLNLSRYSCSSRNYLISGRLMLVFSELLWAYLDCGGLF